MKELVETKKGLFQLNRINIVFKNMTPVTIQVEWKKKIELPTCHLKGKNRRVYWWRKRRGEVGLCFFLFFNLWIKASNISIKSKECVGKKAATVVWTRGRGIQIQNECKRESFPLWFVARQKWRCCTSEEPPVWHMVTSAHTENRE